MARNHSALLVGTVLITLLVVILLITPTSTSAQTRSLKHPVGWEPLDAVGEIASWFRKLTQDFDIVVKAEKRSQLLRSVDRLRKGLYEIEIDTRFLLDTVPDQKPTKEEHEQLGLYVRELLDTVSKLSINLREVGADLRLTSRAERLDLDQIDVNLSYGLRTRALTLSYVQEQLAAAQSGVALWNPEPIRERLRKGLDVIKTAQLAITEFQSKLETERKE